MSRPPSPFAPSLRRRASRRRAAGRSPQPLTPVGSRVAHGPRAPQVVVWEADGEPLPATGYGTCVAGRLRRRGWAVTVVDHRDEEIADDVWAAPVHVLSGGETSSFSSEAWMARALGRTTELARRAWADEVTLIGICLGAQMVARVAAPELPPSSPDDGMEAGWQPVVGPHGTSHVAELHYEQIDPSLASIDGIEVTHSNRSSPIQAFRWGPAASGVQFHPEWSQRQTEVVLGRHGRLLRHHHRDHDAAILSTVGRDRPTGPDLFEQLVAAPVAARLSALATPSDVRRRPIAV